MGRELTMGVSSTNVLSIGHDISGPSVGHQRTCLLEQSLQSVQRLFQLQYVKYCNVN